MKLLHLEIENFGKLSGYSLDLRDGLNILHEPNGWGKSTLATFIKAMLYGMPASTKRNLDQNDRKKYTPWQGGAYGGSLEFESEKGKFRVERFFAAKASDDEFRLFDLSTNKVSSSYSSELGIELFGIDAEGFARSAFLAQQAMEDEQGDNVSVTAKLTGLLEDVNDLGSFDVAMETIDKRRKYYEVKGGRGKIADLTAELSDLTARLQTSREQLPVLEDARNRLKDCRDHIRLTEEQQKAYTGKIRNAELRQVHEDEQKRMENAIRETEEKRAKILNVFAGRQLPSDEEIANARRTMTDFRDAQNELALCELTAEEKQTLDSLKKRYPSGIPSRSMTERVQNTYGKLTEMRAALNAMGELPHTREEIHFAQSGIPERGLLESASAQLSRAEELQNQIEKISGTPHISSPKIPLWLPLTVLIAGLALILCGVMLPSLRIPLLAAGAILEIAGCVLMWVRSRSVTTSRQRTEKQLQELRQELTKAGSYVNGVLERYGIPQQGESLRMRLNQLELLAAQAQKDRKRRTDCTEQLRIRNQQIAEQKQELAQAFAAMCYPTIPENVPSELVRINTDMQEWARLNKKQQAADAKRTAIEAKQSERQAELSAFVNRLTVRESRNPEECIIQITRLCGQHANLLEEIGTRRTALRNLIETHRLDQSDEAADLHALREKESTCHRRMNVLREEETALNRQLDRATVQTQNIPELEDRINFLTAELQTAKANFATLRYTADFLNASKEALSTRYLDGMQKKFAHYRRMIDGPDIPEATIDTSFDISVRDGGKTRAPESYSRGNRDILRFCARLALTGAMFSEGENAFLLLDDPFVNLDERHLAAARTLLERLSKEFQIIYLVCHRDRA